MINVNLLLNPQKLLVMNESLFVFYFVVLFLYCVFYTITMKDRKEDRVHNILSIVIFVLAIALIVVPLCFEKLWKLVVLVSMCLIRATVFLEPSDDSKKSSGDSDSCRSSDQNPIWFMVSFLETIFLFLQTLVFHWKICNLFLFIT